MNANKEERAEIVKSGVWLYDDSIEYQVWIVRQNFEYYFEEAYDDSERLNSDGEVFAVLHAKNGRAISAPKECFSLEEAVAAAETALPQGIRWDNHRLEKLEGGRKYLLERD